MISSIEIRTGSGVNANCRHLEKMEFLSRSDMLRHMAKKRVQ